MHGSGLTKRSLAQVMGGATGAQDTAATPGAKKPTAKEIREDDKQSGEQTVEGPGLEDKYCYC